MTIGSLFWFAFSLALLVLPVNIVDLTCMVLSVIKVSEPVHLNTEIANSDVYLQIVRNLL